MGYHPELNSLVGERFTIAQHHLKMLAYALRQALHYSLADKIDEQIRELNRIEQQFINPEI